VTEEKIEETTPEEVVEKELTAEELQAEWIRIFKFFANPDCTAKDCYGTGNIGIDTKTGRVIGCEKKKCAVFRLKRYEMGERQRKRLEKEKEKELKEKGEVEEHGE